MELFDTHAHVYDKRFDNDREQVLSDVFAHLKYVVCPSENLETSRKTTDLVNRYPRLYGAVGIHPHETCHATEDSLQELESVARENHKIVAIGEIGLDYHYFYSDKEMQQKWFHRQIELAGKLDLPIIIHDRDAHGDTLRILREHKRDSLRGILHCYSGSLEMAKEFIRLGFYISFAGPVVFPKSTKLKQVAKGIPLNRLLIETDSPYLAPPPHRGERNTPRNVIYVAEEIARLKDLSVEAVVFQTTTNACNCLLYTSPSPRAININKPLCANQIARRLLHGGSMKVADQLYGHIRGSDFRKSGISLFIGMDTIGIPGIIKREGS